VPTPRVHTSAARACRYMHAQTGPRPGPATPGHDHRRPADPGRPGRRQHDPAQYAADRAVSTARSTSAHLCLMARLGSAEELAFTVIECVTNPYLNGETIRVDSGIRLPAK
jgi:hypothetical protein